MAVEIRSLRDTAADVAVGSELVREYVVATAEETGPDVEVILALVPDVHDFAGRYLRGGAFLVADSEGRVAGGVGVTPGADGTCEMNRLWIRPHARGRGLGRALCLASMDAARELGFTRMALDVVPERTVAIALYRDLGFTDTEPVHEYPFTMLPLARPL
jgi:ribosomal protein S18 acetylase RimI-like enzyme